MFLRVISTIHNPRITAISQKVVSELEAIQKFRITRLVTTVSPTQPGAANHSDLTFYNFLFSVPIH